MLQNISKNKTKKATWLAFFSIPLSGFVTDIYLPSFPSMSKSLQVSEQQIQLSLTFFLLSYGISQLFIGILLDHIGRYRPKLIAISLLILSNLLIAHSENIFFIYFFRILQGICTSLIIVSSRAFFVDLFEGEQLKKHLSYFTIIWSSGPILAPFIGGYLESLWGWQFNFLFLALYAVILFIGEWFWGIETLKYKKNFSIVDTWQTYRNMLSYPPFIISIMVLGSCFSVIMVFNVKGSFLLETLFNKSAVFIGYCTLFLGVAWMLGGLICKRFSNISPTHRTITPAVTQIGLILLLSTTSFITQNIWILMILIFLIHICSGYIYTVFFTGSLLYFPKNGGIAGGLIGGIVYVIVSISSVAIANINQESSLSIFIFSYLLFSLTMFFCIFYFRKQSKF